MFYVIKSTHRAAEGPHCYYVAVHGFSPYFSTLDRAKRFTSNDEAYCFAMEELFTSDSAFEIVQTLEHTPAPSSKVLKLSGRSVVIQSSPELFR